MTCAGPCGVRYCASCAAWVQCPGPTQSIFSNQLVHPPTRIIWKMCSPFAYARENWAFASSPPYLEAMLLWEQAQYKGLCLCCRSSWA